jgi:hypothetical protein
LLARRDEPDQAAFSAALRALHRRAERDAIPSASLFVAYDLAVVLAPGEPLHSGDREALAVLSPRVDHEPPGLWALRVRTLAAAGRTHEARALLRVLSADGLSYLPCDRDYVGTLGTLLHAASMLGEHEHERALEALLMPHEHLVAVNAAFFSEGPVASLLETCSGRSPEPATVSASAASHP